MPEQQDDPTVLEMLQGKVLRDTTNALNAASVMSYFRNMNRNERNSQRMEAQVDARLKCMYPDTYNPPSEEDEGMSGDIYYGNIIADEKVFKSLRPGKTDKAEPEKKPEQPQTRPAPTRPTNGKMSLGTAALLAAGVLGGGSAIGYGISQMPVTEIPAPAETDPVDPYYSLKTG